jgi:folate-binding protein YgfZ
MDPAEYDALTRRVGIVELPARTQIELSGRDRAAFLNGLCTNDIRRLTRGQSCEAFLTNVQGKTIGYIYVHCQDESLVLETSGGQASTILESLERYHIREQVQLIDRSDQLRELLISGDLSPSWCQLTLKLPAALDHLQHCIGQLEECAVSLRRVPFAQAPSFFLSCPADQYAACWSACLEAGAVPCMADAAEVVRIEAGTPVFGVDITTDNLPQEVGRDQQAISFTKGCYLGQETVARLDALGHVNRLLVGLRLEGRIIPQPGTVLAAGGKPLARITSSCWSPALNAPLALAYVRRGHETPGTRIVTQHASASVGPLPVPIRV